MRKASVCAVAILLGIVSLQGDSFAKVFPTPLSANVSPRHCVCCGAKYEEDLRACRNAHFDPHD